MRGEKEKAEVHKVKKERGKVWPRCIRSLEGRPRRVSKEKRSKTGYVRLPFRTLSVVVREQRVTHSGSPKSERFDWLEVWFGKVYSVLRLTLGCCSVWYV